MNACIISHYMDVSMDYIISKDTFNGLLGQRLRDKFECLRL